MSGDVHLRDVIPADLPVFFEHQRDPVAVRMAAFPARERDDFMAHWAKILRDETVIAQTILCDGQVAGNVVSFELGGERAVGYWIGSAYWGKGVATRALSEFLLQVKTRPLVAHVAGHHAASIRVLEKCGFLQSRQVTDSSGADGEPLEEFIMRLEA